MIIISHRMNTLNYCNKIYELKDGNLVLNLKHNIFSKIIKIKICHFDESIHVFRYFFMSA